MMGLMQATLATAALPFERGAGGRVRGVEF